jgi:GntR family transcriptional regulator, arabinose operon transcriptional repressor
VQDMDSTGNKPAPPAEEETMTLQTDSGRTKHEELTQTLLELVTTLQPGERLPSQTELMRRFQVSDRTVLRSLEDLRRDGWIVRRRGSGTFVADPKEHRPAPVAPHPAPDSRTIAALALSPSPSPFYHRCLEQLGQVVQAAGWSLLCHHARHAPDSDDVLPLEALQPRGFVAFNFTLYPVARRLQERGHRTVILGPPPADVYPDVPCVYGDHDHGGYLVTRHLLDLGHRRLAYVRFFPPSRVTLQRSFRWRGHERAMDEARRRGEEVHCAFLDETTIGPWRRDPSLAADYFRRPDAPTALVVWNDSEAIPLLNILQHAGLHVPEDISVAGYDALPEGAQSLPPLTTVDQHLDCQLRAVMDLLSREAPPPPNQSVVVVPNLVSRASCARLTRLGL